ncbi:unnamed protein product [Lactuca saligna]|uniref:Uncharacterized protein n=1 Tax=Lactuca saligna TaxID=75948 RepID=A0AA35Y6X8_LACSI|nr:unnamed protein product [Lactuca saligna]
MFDACIYNYLFLLASVVAPLVVEAVTAIKVVAYDNIRVLDVRTGRLPLGSISTASLTLSNQQAAVMVVVDYGMDIAEALCQMTGFINHSNIKAIDGITIQISNKVKRCTSNKNDTVAVAVTSSIPVGPQRKHSRS